MKLILNRLLNMLLIAVLTFCCLGLLCLGAWVIIYSIGAAVARHAKSEPAALRNIDRRIAILRGRLGA